MELLFPTQFTKRDKRLLCIVVIVALLFRLSILALSHLLPFINEYISGGDAIGYIQLARHLFDKLSFQFDAGGATAFRMPGYPLFLSITYVLFDSIMVAQLTQIIVSVLETILVYRIAYAISSNNNVSLVAGCLMAFNPMLVISAISLLPETLSLLATTLAVYLLLNPTQTVAKLLVAGVSISCAVYLHPLIAFPALVLMFICIVHSVRHYGGVVSRSLVPLLVLTIALLPWIARNMHIFHTFIPLSTNNGVNMYVGNNPKADGGDNTGDEVLYQVLPGMDEVASNNIYLSRAIDWVKLNPLSFIKLIPAKIFRLLWPLSLTRTGMINVPLFVNVLIGFVTMLFSVLTLLGCWILIKHKRYFYVAILIVIPLVIILLTILTHGGARYFFPALPTLSVLCATGISHFYMLIRRSFKQLGNGIS